MNKIKNCKIQMNINKLLINFMTVLCGATKTALVPILGAASTKYTCTNVLQMFA